MSRSFGIVDAKVAEANFFLGELESAGTNFFKARCYFSAFVSSARSITYAMQVSIRDLPGFDEWYGGQQAALRADKLARFFHEARIEDQHRGGNLVSGGCAERGSNGDLRITYHFASYGTKARPPETDVLTACRHYLTVLVSLVFDCYGRFGDFIDPYQYYTDEAFSRRGLSIEDAEEEVFGWRGWTDSPRIPLAERWRIVRDSIAPCNINHLFEKYLGKELPNMP